MLKMLTISCPYCLVGHAEVPAVQTADGMQVADIRTPRKCVSCGQYMVLRPRVEISGITMQQAAKEGRRVG